MLMLKYITILFILLGLTLDVSSISIDDSDPSIHLLYPIGGEVLQGNVTVRWLTDSSYDSYLISIYITPDDGDSWIPVVRHIQNTGSFRWDTSNYTDGHYRLLIEINVENYIADDHSDQFIIDNNNSDLRIINVAVSTSSGFSAVKNGDTVEIEATLIHGEYLSSSDITANLTCIGKRGLTPAEFFDGSTARWSVSNVYSDISDGERYITIDAYGIESYKAKIIIDNTPPSIEITYPTNGIYFLNRFIFPSNSIYLLFSFTVEGNVSDSNGISSIDIFIDNVLKASISSSNWFRWDCHDSIIGYHILMIKATDIAGHETKKTIGVNVFKFLSS